jgi:hypothetical protein
METKRPVRSLFNCWLSNKPTRSLPVPFDFDGDQTKIPARGELTGAGLVVREGDVQPSHTTTQAADSPVKSNGKPRPLVSDREMSQLNKNPGQG